MNTQTKRRIVESKVVEKLLDGTRVNRIFRELKVGKRRVKDTRQLALEAGYADLTANTYGRSEGSKRLSVSTNRSELGVNLGSIKPTRDARLFGGTGVYSRFGGVSPRRHVSFHNYHVYRT